MFTFNASEKQVSSIDQKVAFLLNRVVRGFSDAMIALDPGSMLTCIRIFSILGHAS